jgi:hypothetical protein
MVNEIINSYKLLIVLRPINVMQNYLSGENKDGSVMNLSAVRTQVNFGDLQTNARSVRTSTTSIRAAKLLKVMAGDRIHTKVDYFYPNGAASTNPPGGPVGTMLNGLLNTIKASTAANSLVKG